MPFSLLLLSPTVILSCLLTFSGKVIGLMWQLSLRKWGQLSSPGLGKLLKGGSGCFSKTLLPHTDCATQEWMAKKFHDHVTSKICPTSSSDLNPLNYYVWSIIEGETKTHAHNTKNPLISATGDVMANMKKDHLAKACSHFRSHIEAVIKAVGSFIECVCKSIRSKFYKNILGFLINIFDSLKIIWLWTALVFSFIFMT